MAPTSLKSQTDSSITTTTLRAIAASSGASPNAELPTPLLQVSRYPLSVIIPRQAQTTSLSGTSQEKTTENNQRAPVGVIAGIAIVLVVVLVVLIVLAVRLAKRKREQKATEPTLPRSRTPSLHTSTSFVESVTGDIPPFSLSTPLTTPHVVKKTSGYFVEPSSALGGSRPVNVRRPSSTRRAQTFTEASIQQEMSEIRAEIERLRRIAVRPHVSSGSGNGQNTPPPPTYGSQL